MPALLLRLRAQIRGDSSGAHGSRVRSTALAFERLLLHVRRVALWLAGAVGLRLGLVTAERPRGGRGRGRARAAGARAGAQRCGRRSGRRVRGCGREAEPAERLTLLGGRRFGLGELMDRAVDACEALAEQERRGKRQAAGSVQSQPQRRPRPPS